MLNFLSSNWGNVASVLGLLVSVIGFIYAFISLKEARDASLKAKDAAMGAEKAAKATRDSIYKAETIANCSSAIGILDEIKRLQRELAWNRLLERYSTVRRILQGVDLDVSEENRTILQGVLAQLKDLESKVDKVATDGKPPPNVTRLNEIVTSQSDKLYVILKTLKQADIITL